MGNGINLTAIFIANGMALLLAAQLLYGNYWKYTRNNIEYRILKFLIYMSAIACIIDPIVFLADGRPGTVFWLIVYVGNMLLFVEDIIIGIGWITIVCVHLNGYLSKFQKWLINILFCIQVIAIIANLFYPIIFYVDDNSQYHRLALFWLFTAIDVVFIFDGICVYLYSKIRGGIFKFFPVFQFIIPIFVGLVLQGAVYGVSVVYPAVMISFTGLFNSFRNEALFMDSLTGIYNRAYFDNVSDDLTKKSTSVTAIMMDINGFKSINDQYGHAEGDVALVKVAHILKSTVGALGAVIRYAGDEFLVLLNTDQQEIIEGCMKSISRAFQEENKTSGKPYELSMSMGYCSLSQQNQTIDDILTEADKAMYSEKTKYYSNENRNRRKS